MYLIFILQNKLCLPDWTIISSAWSSAYTGFSYACKWHGGKQMQLMFSYCSQECKDKQNSPFQSQFPYNHIPVFHNKYIHGEQTIIKINEIVLKLVIHWQIADEFLDKSLVTRKYGDTKPFLPTMGCMLYINKRIPTNPGNIYISHFRKGISLLHGRFLLLQWSLKPETGKQVYILESQTQQSIKFLIWILLWKKACSYMVNSRNPVLMLFFEPLHPTYILLQKGK